MGSGSRLGPFPGKACRCGMSFPPPSKPEFMCNIPMIGNENLFFSFQFLICVRIYCLVLGEELNCFKSLMLVLEFAGPYRFKKEREKQVLFLLVFCSKAPTWREDSTDTKKDCNTFLAV